MIELRFVILNSYLLPYDIGMSVEEKSPQKKLAKKLSERYLRNAGEYYLNRFPASSDHFLNVMTRKIDRSCHDHPDQNRDEWITHVRDALIPYFREFGFINDALYAEAVFNSLKNRGFSKTKIKSRMIQKSIAGDLIDRHLNSDFNDKNAVILFAQKKKIGKYKQAPYADYKEKQKDLGKLARAGFSYDIAISVFE
jgi:regulatory protein